MSLKYFLEWAYWKLIYQRVLANKVYQFLKTHKGFDSRKEGLPKLLTKWVELRTKYDGAEYDQKGYWIH